MNEINKQDLETVSELQTYRGYDLKDVDILKDFFTQEPSWNGSQYVDIFGRKTSQDVIPSVIKLDKLFALNRLLPIPDDGHAAEAMEYLALADAVSNSKKESFSFIELGAGWGPWTSLAYHMCQKKNISFVNLVAVEATPGKISKLKKHMIDNNLFEGNNIGYDLKIISGVVSAKGGCKTFFPSDPENMGAGMIIDGKSLDPNNLSGKLVEVDVIALEDILDGRVFDFLHIDIQGHEFDLLRDALEIFKRQTRAFFIGTHTRLIEGEIIELLYKNNFKLQWEKPCRMKLNEDSNSIIGRTTHDGGQYWINNNL